MTNLWRYAAATTWIRATNQSTVTFHCVRGSPTDESALRRADLTPDQGQGASIAVILADPKLPEEEADRRSLLSILAVEHLYPEVISLAEVLLESNREHFENAYADFVFLPREYGQYLLARTSEFPGTAAYIDELLSLSSPAGAEQEGGGGAPVSFYLRSAGSLGVAGTTLSEAVSLCYEKNKYPDCRDDQQRANLFISRLG